MEDSSICVLLAFLVKRQHMVKQVKGGIGFNHSFY